MFLLKLFLFKRGAPLLFGFLRFAVFLLSAVFAVLWILSAMGCSSAPPPQKAPSPAALQGGKAAMFRKHNTATTQALHGLDKVLSNKYPEQKQRRSK